MANLVNLGCKCGARGGDPSENSHYMIIHRSTPLCIRYCQCTDLNCCIVCWVCVFCTKLVCALVHSRNKTLCTKHENWQGSLESVWTWQNLWSFVQHLLCTTLLRGAWLSWAHYAGKWLSWLGGALCSRAGKFCSAVPAACTSPSTYHTDLNHNHSTWTCNPLASLIDFNQRQCILEINIWKLWLAIQCKTVKSNTISTILYSYDMNGMTLFEIMARIRSDSVTVSFFIYVNNFSRDMATEFKTNCNNNLIMRQDCVSKFSATWQ